MKIHTIRDTREKRIENIDSKHHAVINDMLPICKGVNDDCKRNGEFVVWEPGLSGTLVEQLNYTDTNKLKTTWQWVGWKDIKPRETPPSGGVYR